MSTMTRASFSPVRPAHTFRTITDADWAAELRRARERGADEGNELLAKIRAAVALEEATIARLRNRAGWWEGDQKARVVLREYAEAIRAEHK